MNLEQLNRDLLNAASKGDLEGIKQALAKGADIYNNKIKDLFGFTALHRIAWQGDLDSLSYLIDNKIVDPNYTDDEGKNLLHFSAVNGGIELMEYLIHKARLPVNSLTNNGQTALHIAASNDHYNCVKELILNDADCGIIDGNGDSVYDLANDEMCDFIDSLVIAKAEDKELSQTISDENQDMDFNF